MAMNYSDMVQQSMPVHDPRSSVGQNFAVMAAGRFPMRPTGPGAYQQGIGALRGANQMRMQRQHQVPGTFQRPMGPMFGGQFQPQRMGGGGGQFRPPAPQMGMRPQQQRQMPMGFTGQVPQMTQRQMAQQQPDRGGFAPQQMGRPGMGTPRSPQQQPQMPQQIPAIRTPEEAGQAGYELGRAIAAMIESGRGGMG